MATLTRELGGSRSTTISHRLAVTADDKLTDFAAGDVTIADNGAGTGSLAASTAYYVTACPGNAYGNTKVSAAIDTLTTAAYGASTGSIRATIAQKAGATYYDLFLSVDTAPKWVGRITEAQRAAGGFKVASYGVVSASAGVPAGTVDICCVGTGVQTSAAPFNTNMAFVIPTPDTAISMVGKRVLCYFLKIAITDARVAPSVTYVIMVKNHNDEWYRASNTTVSPLTADVSLQSGSYISIFVEGAKEVIILLDNMTGQGMSVDIYAETY